MNPICVYDFTLKAENYDEKIISKWMKKHCKKWCFQLEKGEETGYIHYQGRFSLKVKKRLSAVISLFLEGGHLSATSSANKTNNFYVLKDETKIGGPWADDETLFTEKIRMPWDLEEVNELRPWQAKIVKLAAKRNKRKVDILVDTKGNSGKTTLQRWMMWNEKAKLLPFCNDFKDLMQVCMGVGPSECYLMNMPRAINKDKLYQLYSAIETIKDGYCYDMRYKFEQRIFDPPNIWIFTNQFPEYSLLTRDRWRVWTIKNGKLKKLEDES